MFYLKFPDEFLFLNNWFDLTNVYYIWSDTIDHRNLVWINWKNYISYHKFQHCKKDKKCHFILIKTFYLIKKILNKTFYLIIFWLFILIELFLDILLKNDKTNIFKIDYSINLMVKFWEFKWFLVKKLN